MFFNKSENKNTLHSVSDIQKQLNAVLEVSNSIAGVTNVDNVLEKVIRELGHNLNYKFPAIFLLNEAGDKLVTRKVDINNSFEKLISVFFKKNIYEISFLLDDKQNILVNCIKENKLLTTDNLYDFARPYITEPQAEIMRKALNTKLMIAVPLSINNKAIGVIGASFKNESITEQQKNLLTTFANQISIAIFNTNLNEENIRQIKQLEQKNQNLESLYNLTSRMSGTLDPKEVSEIAVDQLSNQKSINHTLIFKHNSSKNTLALVTGNESETNVQESKSMIIDTKDHNYDSLNGVLTGKKPISTTKIKEALEPFFDKSDLSTYSKDAKSMVSFPIFSGFKISGIISFVLTDNYEELDENQQQQLKTYSIQVSNALDKARLYRETQENKERLEKALKEVQELRRQEKDMIDIMGHELRTPITIVRNSLLVIEGLQKSGQDIPADKLRKYVEMAVESTRREIALIETLLTATKVDSNRLEFSKEKVDMLDVINDAIEAQKFAAEEKKLEIIYNKPTEEFFAFADRLRSQEIMDNLLSNAIKYTPKGHVKINIKEDKKYVYVAVSDSGMGIDKEDIKNLGKKFFRAKQYINNNSAEKVVRPGGTGLGLYVVFGSIRGMGGDIEVNSVFGKGTTFEFYLPKYSGQKVERTEDTKMKQKISVINVDD